MATRAHLREPITSDKIGALTPVAFATVSVFQTGTTTPVTGTLFSAATGAGTLSNPVTADANGVVEFWMTSPQVVDLSIVASGYNSATVTAQVIGTSTATGILNLNTITTPTAAGDVQINGESFTYEGTAGLHTVSILDAAQTYTALQSFGNFLGGTLQTAAQPNITSVGVLASPHMTGAVVDSGGLTVSSGALLLGSALGAGSGQLLVNGNIDLGGANRSIRNVINNSLSFGVNNTDYVTLNADSSLSYGGSGMTLNNPTGGAKGAGTINVASGIFLNGTAFTNPDYVFEHWATGKIVRYADKPGASTYEPLTLAEMEAHARQHWALPGFGQAADNDLFSGSDQLLARVEDGYRYLFNHESRLLALENRMVGLS